MNSIFNKKTKEENTTYDTLSMFITYKVELQISYSVHPEIQEKNFLWPEKNRNRKNFERYFRLAGSENYRGGSLPRPCTYVCGNTTKVISIKIYGNIKGQK